MLNNFPKVSVLITAYNYASFLPEAIDSVLSQTYDNFELLIIDNCSTDTTVEIVKEYMKKDARIKLHINESNIGMFRNYNQALLLAQGDYIKFLNADDKFHPDVLKKFVNILDNDENISIVTSYRQCFGDSTDILKQDVIGHQNGKEMIISALNKINFIGEPTTVMFRKKNLNLGLFDIALVFCADLDMWLRHLRIGDLYIVDEVLSYVRKHGEQATEALRLNTDKSVYIAFQWPEYVRNSILMNRFGYDLYLEEKKVLKNIFKKTNKVPHRLLLSNTSHNKRVRDYFAPVQPLLYLRYFIKNIFKK